MTLKHSNYNTVNAITKLRANIIRQDETRTSLILTCTSRGKERETREQEQQELVFT